MRMRTVVLFVVSCLPMSLAVGSMANVRVDASIDKADACGLVVDESGRPIADASLTATAGDFKVNSTSVSDGSFTLPETSNRPMSLVATAKGFSPATQTISHLSSAGSRKCKHPVYVVLMTGKMAGASYITMKKKDLPKGAR
jgi:Carboxypeptidase regulatory-like domain